MNSFGRLLRISICGESHGKGVGVILDGCPSGITVPVDVLKEDMQRRRPSTRSEGDIPSIQTGVFNGKTTGAPILIWIDNEDVDSGPYEALKDTPRPGHADMPAAKKYSGWQDYRGGGHFSGRLTAPIVAAGAFAKSILSEVKIHAEVMTYAEATEGDSIGGMVECRIEGLPLGLGEPFFDSIESCLGHAIFSIPGIKGIEFGVGFACCGMSGSEYNDEILDTEGKTFTNNSGGVNGGLTNGNDLVFRVAVRPTASITKEQKTVNIVTGQQQKISVQGRHDACIALRIPVIIEAVSALVLADLFMISNSMRL